MAHLAIFSTLLEASKSKRIRFTAITFISYGSHVEALRGLIELVETLVEGDRVLI